LAFLLVELVQSLVELALLLMELWYRRMGCGELQEDLNVSEEVILCVVSIVFTLALWSGR
jgi:hypothetical protein